MWKMNEESKEFYVLMVLLVIVCIAGMVGGIYLSVQEEAKKVQNWNSGGDPLVEMDHHNVLICGVRMPDAPPPDQPTLLWANRAELRLYQSQHGLCGILDLTKFNTLPVQVMITAGSQSHLYTGFTATYWEPTGKPEPAPPYAWATVALTEREERWWIQFTFRSANQPVTSVTVGVE